MSASLYDLCLKVAALGVSAFWAHAPVSSMLSGLSAGVTQRDLAQSEHSTLAQSVS